MDITMGKHSLFGSIITQALIPAIFGVSYYIFFTKTKKHYGKNGLAERGQILITASVGNKIPKAPWLIYKNHRSKVDFVQLVSCVPPCKGSIMCA
jgi:1-acyl-sn-glycerol-3-phosphate acyltransferase